MGMKYIVWLSCLFLFSCKSEPDASLVNKWQLNSYLVNDASLVQNVPNPIFFTFEKDGSCIVDLDTNSCDGEFTKSSETITLVNFSCTKTCCDSTNSVTAFELFTDSITTYYINGETLKLKGEHGTAMQLSLVK